MTISELKSRSHPLSVELTGTISELKSQIAGECLVGQNENVSEDDAQKIQHEMKDALKQVDKAVKAISELEDMADLCTTLIEQHDSDKAAKDKEIQGLKDTIKQNEDDKAAKDENLFFLFYFIGIMYQVFPKFQSSKVPGSQPAQPSQPRLPIRAQPRQPAQLVHKSTNLY